MRRGILTTILVLLAASSVCAEEGPIARAIEQAFEHRLSDAERVRAQAERERAERAALDQATWVFGATAGADWAVTAVCLKVQCSDRSGKSASFFVGRGFSNAGTAVALGLGLDVAIVYVVRELVAPDHPKLARVLLYGASGVRVVITANKVGDLRDHAARAR